MNAAVIGFVGALVGAGVSVFTTWLTQRSQLQRELDQRKFQLQRELDQRKFGETTDGLATSA